MHRDIKPENFLLTDKTEAAVIKAADFGLCTYFQPGQRFRHIVGSAYYVAPEVLQKNYSHEADMWSLGVVLYILLCGLPPFWGDTGVQWYHSSLDQCCLLFDSTAGLAQTCDNPFELLGDERLINVRLLSA